MVKTGLDILADRLQVTLRRGAQADLLGYVVSRFKTEEEVLAKANDVVYGLAASVWTRDIYKAMNASRKLKFGTVWINDHLPLTSEMPHEVLVGLFRGFFRHIVAAGERAAGGVGGVVALPHV